MECAKAWQTYTLIILREGRGVEVLKISNNPAIFMISQERNKGMIEPMKTHSDIL